MTTSAILGLAAKITWVYHPVTWPELMEFGVHTGNRDVADRSALLDVADGEAARFDSFFSDCILDTTRFDVWYDDGNFIGWHPQATHNNLNISFGSDDGLPHQLAVCITVKNTSEDGYAVGRRRNRSFFGPVQTTLISVDTEMTQTQQDDFGDMWQGLDDDIRGVPATASISPEFDGLAVVSPTEDLMFPAEVVAVGRRLDVHRSRANKSPEMVSQYAIPGP